jgi:hypothetical protein
MRRHIEELQGRMLFSLSVFPDLANGGIHIEDANTGQHNQGVVAYIYDDRVEYSDDYGLTFNTVYRPSGHTSGSPTYFEMYDGSDGVYINFYGTTNASRDVTVHLGTNNEDDPLDPSDTYDSHDTCVFNCLTSSSWGTSPGLFITGGAGSDDVTIQNCAGPHVAVHGETGGDILKGYGDNSAAEIFGDDGWDTIDFSGDTGTGLAFGPGNGEDHVTGGSGNDVFSAGSYTGLDSDADELIGGEGDDVFYVDDGLTNDSVNGQGGNDTVFFDIQYDPYQAPAMVEQSRDSIANCEILTGVGYWGPL